MMKMRIYFLALTLLVCCSAHDNNPVIPGSEDPKQYGVPFADVPETHRIVLYEVNIGSYSTNGNLQGVIDRLDNIKALGINTIWLMPIYPIGQLKGVGSPYAVQDYLSVNPAFGNLDKLRTLVQGAHDRGMAVILDWVGNHTSWDNAWIKNKSWYTQDANGNIIIPPNTNWQDVAELNYDNTDMRKAMISAMKYWVLEGNVDGFRCDAADMVPADFWKQAIDQLNAIQGRELIFLAEGGTAANFTSGFQMNYAWDFYTNLKQVYTGKAASSVFTTHLSEYNAIPAGGRKLRYTTNHDVSAYEGTPVQLFGGVNGALSASVITIFTSPVALVYSSQEVGRSAELPFLTRDLIDWSANPDMEKQYEKLFAIYNSSQVFTQGSLTYFADNDVATFKRVLNSEEYLVIVNVRNQTKNYTLDASVKNTSWTNALEGSAVSLTTTLSLAPYQYLILKK